MSEGIYGLICQETLISSEDSNCALGRSRAHAHIVDGAQSSRNHCRYIFCQIL